VAKSCSEFCNKLLGLIRESQTSGLSLEGFHTPTTPSPFRKWQFSSKMQINGIIIEIILENKLKKQI